MAACVTVVLLFGLLFVLGGGAAEEEKVRKLSPRYPRKGSSGA
jgi:hypothetical protein